MCKGSVAHLYELLKLLGAQPSNIARAGQNAPGIYTKITHRLLSPSPRLKIQVDWWQMGKERYGTPRDGSFLR